MKLQLSVDKSTLSRSLLLPAFLFLVFTVKDFFAGLKLTKFFF